MSSPRPKNIKIKGKAKRDNNNGSTFSPSSYGTGASFSSSPVFSHVTQVLAEMPSSLASSYRSAGGSLLYPGAIAAARNPRSVTPVGLDAIERSSRPTIELALSQEEAARRLRRHLVTRPATEVSADPSDPSVGAGSQRGRTRRSTGAKGPDDTAIAGSYASSSTNESSIRQETNDLCRPNNDEYDEYDDDGNQADDNEDYNNKHDYDYDYDYDNGRGSPANNAGGEGVVVNPLTLPSGDVTHHLYKWHGQANETASNRRPQRTHSFSAVEPEVIVSDSEWDIPFVHNRIMEPGGFRRHFVQERAWREGKPPPNFLTSNFVDFIGLFGHFAGGDYPSDEDDDLPSEDLESESILGRDPGATYGTVPSPCTSSQLQHQRRRGLRIRSMPPGDAEEEASGADLSSPAKPHGRPSHATASAKKAFFLLIKSFVGTGVLFLPRAFYNGGLAFSTFLMLFVAFVALHCALLLVRCYHKYHGSYGDLGYKLFGEPMRQAILGSIVISQIGFCCAYTIFVATNVRDLWNSVTKCDYNYSVEFWVMVQMLIYIPMAMVRKIKNFSLLALIADVFIVLGLSYLYFYDFYDIANYGPGDVQQFNLEKFPLFVGTAVFSFEGIGLVIPVVDSMKQPQKFSLVLTITLAVCLVIFLSAGAFSYLAFGSKTEAVILLNLPNNAWTAAVQFIYSLAILFSVPLQLFPAIRILEAGLFSRSGKGNPVVKWQKNAFRFGLTMLVAGISIFGAEQLDLFVSLIGSFACIPLSFIYPSMLHFKGVASSNWERAKDAMLFVFGSLIMIYTTFITAKTWADGGNPAFDRCKAEVPPS